MKKITILAMIVCLLIPHISIAEAVPGIDGLSSVNGRIVGAVNTAYGLKLQVDMPIPIDCAAKIKQYKMAGLAMDQKTFRRILEGKTMTDVFDAKWKYAIYDEDNSFIFQDDDGGKYVWPFTYYRFSPFDASNSSAALENANRVVRGVMDELGISYEYPFYTVSEACKTMNTQLLPANIIRKEDVAHRLQTSNTKEAEYNYEYIHSVKGFDDDYLFVFVRLQADGIPFAFDSIQSPSYQSDNPIWDDGVFAQFQFTSKGEITYAKFNNMQQIVRETSETRAILPWTECLIALCNDTDEFANMENIMLVRAELCYAINQQHVTYPVWQFVIEVNHKDLEFPYEVYPFAYSVDAITGAVL